MVRQSTKELDVNGNVIRKPRQKRAPKAIEEVTIFFRVKTQAEKEVEDEVDAGFPPSPPASDNEGENEGDENNEEEKKEDGADGEEERKEPKQASPAKAENPEEKIFDRQIKVKPKDIDTSPRDLA